MQQRQAIDWCQFWYPGRRQAFSAAEMARAGSDPPSRTLLTMATLDLAAMGFVALQLAPSSQTARIAGLLVAMAAMAYTASRWLWWNPWRRPLTQASLGVVLGMGLILAGIRWRLPDPDDRYAPSLVLAIGIAVLPALLWFLVIWRAQQIESRLRELDEREKAVEMARRLAAAQLEPHFLFNTLASVQHWVQTGDERAGPLLAALTGFLRATLPMFDRPLLAVADEQTAIEGYLRVMQSRLGAARLVWRIEVEPALQALQLPPGLLLSLVENAVVHGAEPRLSGGEVTLLGQRDGDEAVFEVIDNGPGLAADHREGVGLGNARQRLALTRGSQARLSLGPAPGGGCRAELRLAWHPAAP